MHTVRPCQVRSAFNLTPGVANGTINDSRRVTDKVQIHDNVEIKKWIQQRGVQKYDFERHHYHLIGRYIFGYT